MALSTPTSGYVVWAVGIVVCGMWYVVWAVGIVVCGIWYGLWGLWYVVWAVVWVLVFESCVHVYVTGVLTSWFLPAGARTACERLVLRLLYVFRVCLFVCLFVSCASALITCAIYYIIRYYATAVYSSFWRFAGQATANEGNVVLRRWRKRGR